LELEQMSSCQKSARAGGHLRIRTRLWGYAFIAVAGCNRGGLDLAPVEGMVTYSGSPVADAGVMFAPEQGPSAMATTDAKGRFSLTTANQDGALIGEHRVSISKVETITIPQRTGFPLYQHKSHIPAKYGDVATSELSASVVDGDNYFEFKLK
jgi:hypothetical protein